MSGLKEKPIYESPRVMDLGGLAAGEAADCISGVSANPICISGSSNYDCYTGWAAADSCGLGTVGIPPT